MYGLGDLRVQFALGCKYIKDIYIEELSGHHPIVHIEKVEVRGDKNGKLCTKRNKNEMYLRVNR